MSHGRLVLLLVLPLVVAACDPGPTAPAFVSGNVPFCGFSFQWWENEALNPAARRCLLDGAADGHAELVLVDWNQDRMVTTRLVASPNAVQGIRTALSSEATNPAQTHEFVVCEPLQPVGDEALFAEPVCRAAGNSSAIYQEGVPEQFCGMSQVRHSFETANRDARQCLLDAYEGRGSAFMIETALTAEGDPVGELLQVRDGRIVVFMEAEDRHGYEGRFRYECGMLEPWQRGVYRTLDCTEPQPVN